MTIDKIQEMYQNYAFLPMTGSAGEAVTEATIPTVYSMGKQLVERSYEKPNKWYYLVFKPFDRAYARDIDFFKVKGLDKCRKILKHPTSYIITREIEANKVHINMIVCTQEDLSQKDGSNYCSKYKIFARELKSTGDRLRVLDYITKEASVRSFTKYLDYLIYTRK